MEEATRDRRRSGEVGGAEGSGIPAARVVFVVAGAILLIAMVAAQVASGLEPRPVRLTSVVVLLLAAAAVAFAAADHGLPRAATAFAATAAVGYAAEWIGIRTGVPFGEYRYTDVLWPRLGGVPLIVALAWGGMGLAAHAVARAVAGPRTTPGAAFTSPGTKARAVAARPEAAPGQAARRFDSTLRRVVAGAPALTAWDLFLDPQMIRLGLWTWADPGPYRGVPISNFAGWLVVSMLVMALIDKVLTRPARGPVPKGTGLVTIYTVMAVMETLGFAAVFDPPDLLVAAVGGTCMGVFVLLAWRRRWPR
ncbi:hypothetical protein GCM10022226_53720 [Sphaerisporangium flaviroseum]|uniref:Carotenoid biosynthesis protein n=1 Tax=Sphaerisporangium flaviroseum TaxID=509199 RepID=A0ABP7ITU9_9ACTN